MTRGGFATKKEAQAALEQMLGHLRAGESGSVNLTVAEYLDQWLPGKRSLRPTTFRNYASNIRHYIAPALGHIKLLDLRAEDVDRLLEETKRGVRRGQRGERVAPGPTTVRRVHGTLRSALADAVRRRLVPYNAATQVDVPPLPRVDRRVWSVEQVVEFFRRNDGDRLVCMYWLITVTGLRRGEALGLRWSDLDLTHHRITVRRQHVDVGGRIEVGAPKTKRGSRLVALDVESVARLRLHRDEQRRERAAWGAGWDPSGLVFTRADGRPLRPEYATRHFQRLARTSGLPVIRLHELRHTNASLLLAAGVPAKVVSERLGHSSVGITQDLYTHVLPATDRQAAAALAALLRPGPDHDPDAGGKRVVNAEDARKERS